MVINKGDIYLSEENNLQVPIVNKQLKLIKIIFCIPYMISICLPFAVTKTEIVVVDSYWLVWWVISWYCYVVIMFLQSNYGWSLKKTALRYSNNSITFKVSSLVLTIHYRHNCISVINKYATLNLI